MELHDVQVGRRIKRRRKELKMEMVRLGKLVGIPFQNISKMEDGTFPIPPGTLPLIAAALQVPVTYLTDAEQDETSADFKRRALEVAADVFTWLSPKQRLEFMRQLHELATSEEKSHADVH